MGEFAAERHANTIAAVESGATSTTARDSCCQMAAVPCCPAVWLLRYRLQGLAVPNCSLGRRRGVALISDLAAAIFGVQRNGYFVSSTCRQPRTAEDFVQRC